MNIKALALIVEDHAGQGIVFKSALQQLGLRAALAPDGETAVEHLEGETPHLVLLDLHLPGLTGEEVLQKIRQQEHLTETKVIIASADSTLASTLEDDVDSVLIKPIEFDQLKAIISEILEQ